MGKNYYRERWIVIVCSTAWTTDHKYDKVSSLIPEKCVWNTMWRFLRVTWNWILILSTINKVTGASELSGWLKCFCAVSEMCWESQESVFFMETGLSGAAWKLYASAQSSQDQLRGPGNGPEPGAGVEQRWLGDSQTMASPRNLIWTGVRSSESYHHVPAEVGGLQAGLWTEGLCSHIP